jgi:hypothetical protein
MMRRAYALGAAGAIVALAVVATACDAADWR